jgi:hypothetical protein
LTNETHFRFQTDNKRLYNKYNPSVLGISTFMTEFEQALADEDAALERVNKSADTVRIAEADKAFDSSFSGMHEYAKSCLKHYDLNVRNAAENLKVIFERYGNIAILPYRPALAASYNLLQAVRERAADYATTGLEPWANAHEAAANAMSALIDARTSETAHQTDLHVRDTRHGVDASYQQITDRLDAMINISGSAYAGDFVAEYNAHATEYKNALAQHLGRVHKKENEEAKVENTEAQKGMITDNKA